MSAPQRIPQPGCAEYLHPTAVSCRSFTAGMLRGKEVPSQSHHSWWQKQGTRSSCSPQSQRVSAAFAGAGTCYPGPASIPLRVQSMGYLRPVSRGALAEVGHVRSRNVPHGWLPQQPPG